MKFFGPKSLSTWCYYGTRLFALGCSLLATFILLSFVFKTYKVADGRFYIGAPLFKENLINAPFEHPIILSIILSLVYIGTFFYCLSTIMKSFQGQTLFNKSVIVRLYAFAGLNLVVFPIFFVVLEYIILRKDGLGNIHNLFLSIILGIGVLFVAAIFKSGLKVQKENDLSI